MACKAVAPWAGRLTMSLVARGAAQTRLQASSLTQLWQRAGS
jgi:hypothetical protein